MMTIRWQLTEKLLPGQSAVTLRELLHQQWLLPNRMIHYLRVRHHVLIDDQYRTMNTEVTPEMTVKLLFNGDEFRTLNANQYVPTEHPSLQVLYENRDLLVINKPRGQKSHPNYSGETGTVMNDVAGYSDTGAYMVHRLDRLTSGAMIVAKNPVVVPILDRLISAGSIHREYVAIVDGQLTGQGSFHWPIGRNPADPRFHCVDGLNAQPALTEYQALASNEKYSLVRLRLGTGRTHQLRVHLAHSGHPIVGDPIYNSPSDQQMLLHGITQKLVVPFTLKKEQIQAPLPPYFAKYLVKYKLG